MTCPRCSVAEISPASGACELCGFVPEGGVAVDIPQPDATDELARLQLAHEFRLDVLLGHGEKSAVYLAREGNSSSYVVLKVLPRSHDRDPQADDRFRRAAELVSTLDHPHIVPVNRYGTTDSLFWYTMDHVRARSLREILRSRGPLELKTCQRVVAQIASALDYAHRRGVVHGDLKPENVLIDPNGWVHICDALVSRELERPTATPRASTAAPRPSLSAPRPSSGTVNAPFSPPRSTQGRATPPGQPRATPGEGAARQTPSGQPARNTPSGQPARSTPSGQPARSTPTEPPRVTANTPRRPDYQSPEDLRSGQRTSYADQYALAVLVHECLTGSVPSAGADAYEPPATLGSLRPDLPAHVTHAVTRALSPKPTERFPNILDFALALETGVMSLTDSRPSGRASDIVLTVPDWEPPPSNRPKWLFPLLGLLVVAAGLWFGIPKYRRWNLQRQWAQELNRPAPATVTPDSTTLRAMADSMNRSATANVLAGSTTTNPAPVTPAPTGRSGSRRRELPTRDRSDTPARSSNSGRQNPRPAATTPSATPNAPAGDPGKLFVNASPWGQVFIDGQPVGNTPRANLPITPGTHTVRVVREGFEPFERSVTVGAGETVRLTDIVLNPRP